MVRDLADDSAFADQVERHLSKRNIVRHLFAMRSARGVSQKEMAERMDCSQSRISKLENSEDDDLRLGDLRQYLAAMGFGVSFSIHPSSTKIFDQIKFHAGMINHFLRAIADLSKGDEKMERGAVDAHLETLVNMVRMVMDSAKKIGAFQQAIEIPSIVEQEDTEDSGDAIQSHPLKDDAAVLV